MAGNGTRVKRAALVAALDQEDMDVMATAPKPGTKSKPGEAATRAIVVKPLAKRLLRFRIVGETELVVHRFGAKALYGMLASQLGLKAPKEKRDAKAEYERALYVLQRPGKGGKERYGFPVTGIKDSWASAAVALGAVRYKNEIYRVLRIRGEPSKVDVCGPITLSPVPCAEIMAKEIVQRTDAVRLSGVGRKADLRFRPSFVEWSIALEVEYMSDFIAAESIVNIADAAGKSGGIGENRQERGGEWGSYSVVRDAGSEGPA